MDNLEFKWDLQRFAEGDPNPGDGNPPNPTGLTQEQVDEIVKDRLKRERQRIEQLLGADPEDVAAEIEASRQILKAAGLDVSAREAWDMYQSGLLNNPQNTNQQPVVPNNPQTGVYRDPRVDEILKREEDRSRSAQINRLQTEYGDLWAKHGEEAQGLAKAQKVDIETAFGRILVRELPKLQEGFKKKGFDEAVETVKKKGLYALDSSTDAGANSQGVQLTAPERAYGERLIKEGIFKSLDDFATYHRSKK